MKIDCAGCSKRARDRHRQGQIIVPRGAYQAAQAKCQEWKPISCPIMRQGVSGWKPQLW